MTEPKEHSVDTVQIIVQIADLSKMLGMIPSDDTITLHNPVTDEAVELSQWFDETRYSFLKLSILIDIALDLNLQ